MPFSFSPVATREEAITVAREVISKQPIYLDTETTGLNENDEIIEIAIIDHNGSLKLNSLIRPTIQIPMSSTNINGISDPMVRQAPFWNSIWPQVNELLKNHIICTYNSEFDRRMMMQSQRKFKLPWDTGHFFFDIMGLFSIFNHEWDPIHRSYRLIRLENAGIKLGIHLPNSHRSLDDTRLARAVLHSIAGLPY
jgi:DNA polymerase III subunit epsilon